MDNEDHKNTWNNFTKFVLWGSVAVIGFLVLMAINLQTSFLTPPFGFALFYLKGVAPPEVATLSIYRGVVPFVIIQLIGLGFVIYQPEMALWLPRLI